LCDIRTDDDDDDDDEGWRQAPAIVVLRGAAKPTFAFEKGVP
jgi:hypothetical protein